jgi:hypothetical protein
MPTRRRGLRPRGPVRGPIALIAVFLPILLGGGPLLAAGTVIKADDALIEIAYRFPAPTAVKNDAFDALEITGLAHTEIPGEPRLPVQPVRILIPYGRRPARVEAVAAAPLRLPGQYLVAPVQMPVPLSQAGTASPTPPNPEVYRQPSAYPGRTAAEHDLQRKGGFQFLQTLLYPVAYYPLSGEVYYTPEIRVRVALEPEPAGLRGRAAPAGGNKAEIQTMVDNPHSIETYPEAGAVDSHASEPQSLTLPAGDFKYVIITSPALAASDFTKLIAHKRSRGTTAKIVTTDWIYANYSGKRPDGGSDHQTRIRNFIIDAHAAWGTEYVLLGGAATIVPDRKFRIDFVNQTPRLVEDIPADMYYGCLDGTFDHDADGLYGEPNDGVDGKEVDLYHEVYIGRAAVENKTDVENFVAKTIAYDTTVDSYLYVAGMVGELIAGNDYATPKLEQIRLGYSAGGHATIGFESSASAGWFITHHNQDGSLAGVPPPLYDEPGKWWGADTLIDWINEGRGAYKGVHILNHYGHCSTDYCLKLTVSQHLSKLKNTRPVFIYTQGCHAGRFDANDCFAEEITRMRHGAFAVIANSRYGWSGLSNEYNRDFWHGVLGEGILELGRANAFSKEFYMPSRFISGLVVRWPYYALNLFGDPQLKLKAKDADALFEIDSVSTASHYAYGVSKPESPLYSDAPDKITSLSSGLKNGILVQTAMADRMVGTDKHLVLRFERDAVVWVAYDKRAAALPAWLNTGWAPEAGEFLVTTNPEASPMRLFKKAVSADADLVLGGNLPAGASGALSHYAVIVKPAVEIVSVSTGRPYAQTEAVLNARPYIDRDSVITAVSGGLRHGVLVKTAMDDKKVSAASHLTLRLHKAATVYVAYDKRANKLPTWLQYGWTLTNETISTSDPKASPYKVYRKTAAAGALLTLGGNFRGGDTGAEVNYFLVVRM